MSEEFSNNKESIKTYCFNCNKETNQDILYKENEIVPSEIILRNKEGNETQTIYTIIAELWSFSKCRGCGRKNFKHILRKTNKIKDDEIFHFPENLIRKAPNWIVNLPMKYFEVLQEVYHSINANLFILSLTGIRTVLDIYIVDKVGDIGTFKKKINKLVSEGIITSSKAIVLETAIDAGNASAHRGYKPDKETLFQILDIVENLLQSEIVDRPANKIKEKTPQRK